MRSERAWPQQCWKSCANGSNIVALRFGDHGTKEMLGVVGWKVWPVSNFAQQHATTSNIMQQGVQTYATCNIQQCWELLANNVASVCTGLKKNNNPLHQQAVCLIFGLQRRKRGKALFCSRLSSLIRLIWVIQNYHEGYQLHLAGKMFPNL